MRHMLTSTILNASFCFSGGRIFFFDHEQNQEVSPEDLSHWLDNRQHRIKEASQLDDHETIFITEAIKFCGIPQAKAERLLTSIRAEAGE